MTSAIAARPKLRGRAPAAEHDYRSADEMREVIGRALEAVDRNARAGTTLRAAGLNILIEIPNLKSVISVRASDEPGHYIQWRFDRRGKPKPNFVLTMSSDVANAWLQGRESIPMAIARRRMKCSGGARDALRYVPVLKVISQRYRKLVRSDYPHLAI
jgi:hypothetical protein